MTSGLPLHRKSGASPGPLKDQRQWLEARSPRDRLLLDAAFEAYHAPDQLQPEPNGWHVWLMLAGRGFGKTRGGVDPPARMRRSGAG